VIDHPNRTGAEQDPFLHFEPDDGVPFFEPYENPDPATLPRRPEDFYLRKCARMAAFRGETFAEMRAAWDGRHDETWWRLQYRERPEPEFSEDELASAYAEAVSAAMVFA
jgi:hypothetical protein